MMNNDGLIFLYCVVMKGFVEIFEEFFNRVFFFFYLVILEKREIVFYIVVRYK